MLRVDDVCGGGGRGGVGKCSGGEVQLGGSRVRIVVGFIMRLCVSLYSSDAFVVVVDVVVVVVDVVVVLLFCCCCSILVQSNQSPRRLPAPHEWWW